MEDGGHKRWRSGLINTNTDLKQMALLPEATDWTVPFHTGLKKFSKKYTQMGWTRLDLCVAGQNSVRTAQRGLLSSSVLFVLQYQYQHSAANLRHVPPTPPISRTAPSVSFPLRHKQKQREVHKAEDPAFLSSFLSWERFAYSTGDNPVLSKATSC